MQVLKAFNGHKPLFTNFEMRIGNVDKSQSKVVKFWDENKLVACRDGIRSNEILEVFNMEEPISGRYLTLQTYNAVWMIMDEINVFT